MAINVLTVTYGERSDYMFQVLDSLAAQGVNRVCIVFNGCSSDVVEKISNKAISLMLTLDSIVNNENEGSAGGFYRGLKYLKENDLIDDRLLILDDDNLIPHGLIDDLEKKEVDKFNIGFVLREDRASLLDARKDNNPFVNVSTRNSFLGRDIFKSVEGAYETVGSEIVCVPYSGMLLHKKTLEFDVLPEPGYYLYSDDYDFSYRLVVGKGCKIHIYPDKMIKDLEKSFHLNKSKRLLNHRYLSASKIQLYYSVRNQIIFSNLRIDNKVKFSTNAFLLSMYIGLSFLINGELNKLFVFSKAIKDGVMGVKGRTYR